MSSSQSCSYNHICNYCPFSFQMSMQFFLHFFFFFLLFFSVFWFTFLIVVLKFSAVMSYHSLLCHLNSWNESVPLTTLTRMSSLEKECCAWLLFFSAFDRSYFLVHIKKRPCLCLLHLCLYCCLYCYCLLYLSKSSLPFCYYCYISFSLNQWLFFLHFSFHLSMVMSSDFG